MPFQNTGKPLQVLWQRNIPPEMLLGVYSGVALVLSLAGVFQEFKIEHLGQRRQADWLIQDPTGLSYNPYKSLDWHIWLAQKHSQKERHLNSILLLDSLAKHPTFATEPRYELVVVDEALHWNGEPPRTVGGIGKRSHGAIINIGQFKSVPSADAEYNKNKWFDFYLATQRLAVHELGHMFGLYPGTGKTNPTDDELKASHCQNDCVMWWIIDLDLYKRTRNEPFCKSCIAKLKQFFII